MNDQIEKKLRELPNKSGVYIMHAKDGTIIYVGKAKNLKNRVSSYFNNTKKAPKVLAMVDKVDWFEYIITPSELDAFTLENNLIKKEQPFYNILLKDSKTFPYIKVDLKNPYPRFETTRRVEKDGAKYFGPYLAGVSAKYILDFLNKYFKLRTCKLNLNKQQKRECINYSMGLCDAPCTRRISQKDYRQNVDKAIAFLKGDDKQVIDDIESKMLSCAANENFEKAIEYRQTYQMLKRLNKGSIANLPKSANKDAICYTTNDITSAVAILTLSGGKILGVQTFSITDPSIEPGDVLANFVTSYYQNAILPDEIITNYKIENTDTINQFLGKKIKFIDNPKGLNLKLLNMAKENATEHIEKNITRDRQKYDSTLGAIKLLQEKLHLNNLPKRMECYDISNISGTYKVSSMVVFVNGEPKKSDYRKFKIKTVKGQDDFACLKETLTRRLTRLKEQQGESFKEKPDLIIIDGGKGQLSSCYDILYDMGFKDIDMISLAKRIEEVFVPYSPDSIILDHSTAPLKLLQRIRDEAHRFAITFHRQIRGKGMLVSQLDNIYGVGDKKKAELLKVFGDVDQIKNASIEELSQVKGIDLKLAHLIYNTLHNKKS